MSTIASQHHFRWLNLLIRHLATSAGNSATGEQAGTDGQSKPDTDLALLQSARMPTIVQEEAAELATGSVPADIQAAHQERQTSGTSLSVQDRYPGRSAKRNRMHCKNKKVRLVINPRAGHNFKRISDVLAVFSAAGWKTDLAVKLHGGHARELATEAAEEGYDLVIAYGGDGTINQVVNGVMVANRMRKPVVGVLPGGTANQWVSETGERIDPVKAALSLIDSDVGAVDLGHIQVQALNSPNTNQEGRKAQKTKAKPPETYFLLTAGLGIDAAVISHTSKTLKQRLGRLAFDLAAAEVLPEQHAFPIEIASIEADGQNGALLWSGEVFQVILGNTRRYANAIEITPDAYVDDEKLDLCVITEGKMLATLEQMVSFLVRRRPDSNTARNFQGTHFLITVPASIHLQLDGSAVQLEDYLSKADRKVLQQVPDRAQVMVSYRFDAVPHALRVALPQACDTTLFQHLSHAGETHTTDEQRPAKASSESHEGQHREVQRESSGLINTPRQDEYETTVAGVVVVPCKKPRYVIAGNTVKRQTGETKPVAVRLDEDATVLLQTGWHVPLSEVQQVQEGAVVIVRGKKNRRGVIKAKQVLLPNL